MVRMLITVTVILSVSRAEAADYGNLARRRGHGLSASGILPPKRFIYRASPRSAPWKEEIDDSFVVPGYAANGEFGAKPTGCLKITATRVPTEK